MNTLEIFKRIDPWRWEIPTTFQPGMRVPGLIYTDREMLEQIGRDQSLDQVANVAALPGIVGYSLAMPDIHQGYGFPIGGVAATDPSAGGVISPGGVGFDINCGVRLLRTGLEAGRVRKEIHRLLSALFSAVPAGVGCQSDLKLSNRDEERVLSEGSGWAVARGLGTENDRENTEGRGCLAGADPGRVGKRARERGRSQLGTLGSGNHFLEIQYVDEIYDPALARSFGIEKGQVTVMIHCGSRGLGHQVCSDAVQAMGRASRKYGYTLPDRQLACAPTDSPEGKDYFAAMACAANYAWANRQIIMDRVRKVFEQTLGKTAAELKMGLVYDVAHNIAKFERHRVGEVEKTLCVHRKGATRAFPPGHPELPVHYRASGQPVLIPGDMGSCSFLLAGTERAMAETWGSTCHGAGRVMSRTAARKAIRGRDLAAELKSRGIEVMAGSMASLAEEAPRAYKDVSKVVEVVHRAGLARKVARMRPLGVIKG
jgi:tRNA-splicing ligase RtcB (3'-phosphate/5'-hydroxy nucleic acid ligase)